MIPRQVVMRPGTREVAFGVGRKSQIWWDREKLGGRISQDSYLKVLHIQLKSA